MQKIREINEPQTNSLVGLKYLIRFQQCFGVHYRGALINSNKLIGKVLIIGWSLIILSIILYLTIGYYLKYKFLNEGEDQKKSIFYSIINIAGSSTYSISSLIIYIILILNGEQLLVSIQTLVHKLYPFDSTTEKRIGITFTIVQILIHIILNIIYLSVTNRITLIDILYFLLNSCMDIIQTSIIAVIGYQSFLISEYLKNLDNNISPVKLHNK